MTYALARIFLYASLDKLLDSPLNRRISSNIIEHIQFSIQTGDSVSLYLKKRSGWWSQGREYERMASIISFAACGDCEAFAKAWNTFR